jgi:type I restriction enzyme S subunit
MAAEFPTAWKLLPIESCMAAIIDYRGKSPRKVQFGIPLITAKIVKGGRIFPPDEYIAAEDYDEWMRRGIPKAKDIVLTTEAPLGEVAQLDGCKVALAQRLITLRGKADVLDNDFLKFVLQSAFVQNQLRARATGTTVHGIRQSELRKVLLPLPPISEQLRIAHILGALDDKIELNRKMNETLEAIAGAIFKSWFVDFDPVRAKAEGHQPICMSAEIAALFPNSLRNGIPQGWGKSTLSTFTELQNGYAFKSSDWQGVGVPVVKIGSVTPRIVNIKDVSFVSSTIAAQQVAFALKPGDILVGLTGYVGETGRIPPTSNPPLLNQRVARFFPKKLLGEPSAFVYTCVRDPKFKDFAIERAHGSAQPNVSTKELLSYPVVNPGLQIIKAFEEISGPLLSLSLSNCGEVDTLLDLRDLLLPKLMSGQLRVKDVEKLVSA